MFELGSFFIREHPIFQALRHGLGGHEHGEDWNLRSGKRVIHESLEDGELVEHVQHEQVQ